MKRIIPGILVFFLAFCPSLFAALSKPIVRYDIQATLIPQDKTVKGQEILTWLNDSDGPVTELRFHLYLNAFKNNRTTMRKESGGLSGRVKPAPEDWGFITIHKIQIQDGVDLTPNMTYLQPDDQNSDDQTVMKVTLPVPVKPQEKINLAIDFTSKLPKVRRRSGFSGDFFMVAQWFPKIGVLWNGTWNCHQYHSSSEFFADYGVYKVEITAPERFVVGATGKRIAEKKHPDGKRSYTYYQEDVHDFAWTACPDFVEFKEKFKLDNPKVDTEMILLVHRAHLKQKDRYLQALKNGIEFYSKNYGPYPYETITLVDPAPGASEAGGMEYPTLFTSITMSWMPKGVRLPEMITIHEFGHGYWYGIVGSNEFEEAWLDEGINSYSEVKAMSKYYGVDRSMIDIGNLKIGDLAFQRIPVIGSGKMDPIVKNSWEYVTGGSYGLNVYNKAALMLLTLEKWLGEDVMAKIMKTYYEKWKFRHPRSQDFVQVAEEVSGRDLKWFFDQVLRSPDKLDYAIGSLKSEEVKEPEGIFDGKTAEAKDQRGKASNKPLNKAYRNEVVAVRYGDWIFPQDILIVFENGEKIRETWDGKDRWKRFVYWKPVRLASAQVDPDRKMVLDVNYTNNSKVLTPKRAPIMKYALGFMTFFQGLLSFVSL
jgi:hypothetical protein